MLGKKIGVHRWTQIDTDFLLFLSLSVLTRTCGEAGVCVNLWTVFTLFAEGGLSRLGLSISNLYSPHPAS